MEQSVNFDENLSSNPQVVFNGSKTFVFDNTVVKPSPFSIVFEFEPPFYYDPSNDGNLVVDIKSFGEISDENEFSFDFFVEQGDLSKGTYVGPLILNDKSLTSYLDFS
jgi:hypothetical protein